MKLFNIKGILFEKNQLEKATENSETISLPLPEKVTIPLYDCNALVKKGDNVFRGQKIGENSEKFPVFSSVSGEITDIKEITLPDKIKTKAVEIKTDGLQTNFVGISSPEITDKASFIDTLKNSGCREPDGTPSYSLFNGEFSTIIISPDENEPYITSAYRCLVEDAEKISEGIEILKKYLQPEKIIIGINHENSDEFQLFKEKFSGDTQINVKYLKSTYPQCEKKILVYNLADKNTTENDVAVIDISSVAFISDYIKTGIPFIDKRITVDGDIVKTPCNVLVPVGTSVKDVLTFAETNFEFVEKIVSRGTMKGYCVENYESPVCITDNSVLAFKTPIETGKLKEAVASTNCFNCGRCTESCPENLFPARIEKAFDKKNLKRLEKLNVNSCINCGNCTYICPARHNLAEKVRQAKEFIRNPANDEKEKGEE